MSPTVPERIDGVGMKLATACTKLLRESNELNRRMLGAIEKQEEVIDLMQQLLAQQESVIALLRTGGKS